VPEITMKKIRPARFARHAQLTQTGIVFTHGFINIVLSKGAVAFTCITNAYQQHKQGL